MGERHLTIVEHQGELKLVHYGQWGAISLNTDQRL